MEYMAAQMDRKVEAGISQNEQLCIENELLLRERNDLALLVGRLIQRMRAARVRKGTAAGDDALEQQATDYLRRKGLVKHLRNGCEEAGHDEGKCGNATCI